MSDVSKRLIDQRLRNRIMEALLSRAEWEEYLTQNDATEYFEGFFDFVPYEGIWPNSTMTGEESEALSRVHRLIAAACDASPTDVTNEQLIASGWPLRIAEEARGALRLMLARGRHDEEQEEEAPSQFDWPWRPIRGL